MKILNLKHVDKYTIDPFVALPSLRFESISLEDPEGSSGGLNPPPP